MRACCEIAFCWHILVRNSLVGSGSGCAVSSIFGRNTGRHGECKHHCTKDFLHTCYSTRCEETCHLDILRIHKLHEVFHNDVHAVLVEVAMITEAEKVELQALALHHLHIRHIRYAYLRKVGLTGNRTQRCELRTVETHPVVVALMLVDKCLKHFRCIVVTILCLRSECLQAFVAAII